MPQIKKYLMFIVIFAISLSATIYSAFALHKGNNDVLASKIVVTTKIKSLKRQKEVEKNVVKTYIPKTQINEFKKLIGDKEVNNSKKKQAPKVSKVIKKEVHKITKKCDDEITISRYDKVHNVFVTSNDKHFRLFGINLTLDDQSSDTNKVKLADYITKNFVGKKLSIVYPNILTKADVKDYSFTDEATGKFVSVYSWFAFVDGKNISEILANENLVNINDSEIYNTNDEFIHGLQTRYLHKKDIEISNDIKFQIQKHSQTSNPEKDKANGVIDEKNEKNDFVGMDAEK